MRISMISYYLPSGSKIGVGYQVHALANELVDRGHQVTVFSGCGASDGARYETVQIPLVGSNRTFKFAWALRQVDWTAFDVLHAHGDDYWLADRVRPFHVRTLHGSCFAEARHVSGLRERLRMGLLGLSEVKASMTADTTIRVSDATFRRLPWLSETIPNGVDLKRLHPGAKSPQPSIAFVGTFQRRKRGWLLLQAFESTVRPLFPDAELWMVCEDAPERPGVKVFGRIDDDALAALLRQAWVFSLPSSYEGFGIPYIEAMASGTPVVATRNLGACEVLKDGAFGNIVADDQLGPALVSLLTSEPERERRAVNALGHVRKFDLVAVADRYEALYRSGAPGPFRLWRRRRRDTVLSGSVI